MSKKKAAWYRGFTPDTTDDAARAAFEERFGYPAGEVVRTEGAVLAGPVRPQDLRPST
jgi:hypothetical protein